MAKSPKHLRKEIKRKKLMFKRFFKQMNREPYVPSQDQVEFMFFEEQVNQHIIDLVTGAEDGHEIIPKS